MVVGDSNPSRIRSVSKTRAWAKNQLENLTPYPFVKDKSVHWVIEEGPVSDEIVKCADAYDVDLVAPVSSSNVRYKV
jgi:hypothetical protein